MHCYTPTHTPRTITETLSIVADLGEIVAVTAYLDTGVRGLRVPTPMVVVEVEEGCDRIPVHLTVAQARQHIEHVLVQIAAAKRLAAGSLIARLRLVPQEK